MLTTRANLGVGVIAGKLYALGGQNGGEPMNVFEMYDPVADVWTSKASFPTGIANPVIGIIDGKMYVAGGLEVCCTSLATLRVYDPATDAWTSKASMPSGRNQAAGGAINGILYVSGGIEPADNTKTLFAYDPATDSWTTKAPMSTARGGHAAATINDKLYVVGGNSSGGVGPLTSLEVYTPTGTPPPRPPVGPPTDKDLCKKGGWQIFNTPRTFKNQGDCIQFVNTGK
jgi:N-acetylneuraminic acid mutarotase